MKKTLTLIVVHNDSEILLGMKKRGFGSGRWNGFGGKVVDGETIKESALRELREEASLVAKDLKERGVLNFSFEDSDDLLEVHLFSVTEYTGVPVESEEMRPQWFKHSEIPYSQMWADDPYWLPQILEGKNVNGMVHFDNKDNQYILKNEIQVYE